MSFIRRAWKGDEKLWKVFWLGVFLPYIIDFFVGVFIATSMIASGVHDKVAIHERVMVLVHGLPWRIIVFVYFLLFFVVGLRCCKNVGKKFWAYLAVVVMIFYIIVAAGGLYGKVVSIQDVSPASGLDSVNGSSL